MAKILSLRLNYKGKFLDYAKEGKEIKKNFTIGSNKFLQWQILDPSFPDKHQFIQQKGGEFVMQMLPGAQLSCEQGGKSVDSNYLKQNNLLSGNELVLKKDIKGTLTLAPDWSVDFEYREPWVVVLTDEERQIVALYARRAKPDAVSNFNRMVLWLVLLISLVFLVIFDAFLKPEYTVEETLAERLQASQSEAQKVKADLTPITGGFVAEQAPADEAQVAETAQTGTPGGTGRRGSSAIDAAFAGGYDPNATGVVPAMTIATIQEGFAARRPGGGTGGGTGPGGGALGGTGGAGSQFDASARPSFGDVGSVVQKGPATAGHSTRPEGAFGAHITGDASRLAPSGKEWGDVQAAARVAADFAAQGIRPVREGNIAQMTGDQRARFVSVREEVEARKVQIEQAYREYQVRGRTSFTITIFISQDGSVRESRVIPNGEYPAAFVEKVKELVNRWRFNVREAMAYEFRISAGS